MNPVTRRSLISMVAGAVAALAIIQPLNGRDPVTGKRIRLVRRSELDTLPPGLYTIDEPIEVIETYDPRLDRFVRGRARQFARIREDLRGLPRPVTGKVRPDGRVIIFGYEFVER